MVIASDAEWIALEKTIRGLDDATLSKIAFWCWSEQIERDVGGKDEYSTVVPKGENGDA